MKSSLEEALSYCREQFPTRGGTCRDPRSGSRFLPLSNVGRGSAHLPRPLKSCALFLKAVFVSISSYEPILVGCVPAAAVVAVALFSNCQDSGGAPTAPRKFEHDRPPGRKPKRRRQFLHAPRARPRTTKASQASIWKLGLGMKTVVQRLNVAIANQWIHQKCRFRSDGTWFLQVSRGV